MSAQVSSARAVCHSSSYGLSSHVCSSLIFDVDVDDDRRVTTSSRPVEDKKSVSNACERLQILASPVGDFPLQLLSDVEAFKKVLLREEHHYDAVLLACKLANVGYTVHIRNSLGGGESCFRNLRNEFLIVHGEDEFEGVKFIVEPQFRDQFCITSPTPQYEEILNNVPEIFVGTSSHLIPMVQLLCKAMAESFQWKGLTLPPWRMNDSMLTKWLPVKSKDTSVHSTEKLVQTSNKLHGRCKDNWQPQLLDRQASEAISTDSFDQDVPSPRESLLSRKLSNGNPSTALRVHAPQFAGEATMYSLKLSK